MKRILIEIRDFIKEPLFSIVAALKNLPHQFDFAEQHKKLVILVPGYTLHSHPRNMRSLKALFSECGYSTATFVAGNTTRRDIKELAFEFGEFVRYACKQKGAQSAVVVAHSMGGLIARYYLQKLAGDKYIEKLITLGTPHHGTRMAYAVLHTHAAWQMLPNSVFIKELNESTDFLDRIVSIRAKSDLVIKPKTSPILEGAKNIEVNVIGHVSLKRSAEALQVLKKELM